MVGAGTGLDKGCQNSTAYTVMYWNVPGKLHWLQYLNMLSKLVVCMCAPTMLKIIFCLWLIDWNNTEVEMLDCLQCCFASLILETQIERFNTRQLFRPIGYSSVVSSLRFGEQVRANRLDRFVAEVLFRSSWEWACWSKSFGSICCLSTCSLSARFGLRL